MQEKAVSDRRGRLRPQRGEGDSSAPPGAGPSPTPFSHGLRPARLAAGCAPPAATCRRPCRGLGEEAVGSVDPAYGSRPPGLRKGTAARTQRQRGRLQATGQRRRVRTTARALADGASRVRMARRPGQDGGRSITVARFVSDGFFLLTGAPWLGSIVDEGGRCGHLREVA